MDDSPVETHPIAFSARAKTESDAQSGAAALRRLGYEIISIEKTWWRPFLKWEVVALTRPMPITRRSTEEWVREAVTQLSQSNVVLKLWAPAAKPAA